MTSFLLATPAEVLRAYGTRAGFTDPAAAAAALRGGDPVVGALPFDPRRPAALIVPERLERSAPGPVAAVTLPPLRVVAELPSPDEHIARVTKLVEQIGDPADPLRKVVAARSVLVGTESRRIDPQDVAARLRQRHPGAHVFAADLAVAGRPGDAVVGASPEVLVARRGGVVSLRPLAGTVPRLADPAADAARAEALRADAKNLEEHAYVVEWIRERLAPVCRTLRIPERPELVRTDAVWHLASPIDGTLADPAPSALDLAVLLHPTPAVCGTPTLAALDRVVDAEEDRGFYGGAVGWCTPDGDGEWVVAIRSAEIAAGGHTLRAFAGGGIVAGSDPRTELDETTAKLRTLLGALDCPVPTH
ncbi:isochorismate synthase [Nocardia jiangsuensis]|uniref:isochorismate synthase n=1 Tax=Nocardia jiangsuensis TaxID=1691563 RepID=A0ABV8DUA8_9NOCA